MDFETYYTSLSPEAKRDLAEKLGITVAYLRQIAHGHRRAGARVIARIAEATQGAVTPADLRPDLYS
jgi:DNA-binding transcriptional regulator YdaS (Cro superfamily)